MRDIKRNFLPVTLLPVWVACLSTFGADTYNIDPAHSTVGFAVNHKVINTVHGKFDQFSGKVVLDGTCIQEAAGTIQTASVNTGVTARDNARYAEALESLMGLPLRHATTCQLPRAGVGISWKCATPDASC